MKEAARYNLFRWAALLKLVFAAGSSWCDAELPPPPDKMFPWMLGWGADVAGPMSVDSLLPRSTFEAGTDATPWYELVRTD